MNSSNDYLTFCHICPAHCSRNIRVYNDNIVQVGKENQSGLPNEWCASARGKTIKDVCSHPQRLRHPVKRAGKKGEGKWERISWDEALDTIADKLLDFKKIYGPESIAFFLGEPKGMEFAFAQRLASVLGTPNVATPGNY